jgi:selenide, water dikinase
MRPTGPLARDIVLVGGGHAHVHVITAFARRPEQGTRVTIVTRDLETPYSGMMPGMVAGLYERREAHIDLVRLCAATGTRLIHATARGLDRTARRVLLEGRPALGYDLVSIDVGITPSLSGIAGAERHAIAVKPIGSFLEKFETLRVSALSAGGPRRIVVVGGGAGGVELLLSLRNRMRGDAARTGADPDTFSFALVTADVLLATHNPRVRQSFREEFARTGVTLHERRRVTAIDAASVHAEGGAPITADAVLVATGAAAPGWLRETGLPVDADGFLAVGSTLQSTGDPTVFAAGDCAALVESPREKAGVYAVRAGPPLARSLRAVARGESPRAWTPQKRHLALISTGERYAVASRGALKAEGAWLWRLKDRIDRRWMRMYQDAGRTMARMASRPAPTPPDPAEAMRCGGCAAKIGPGPLSRALARLDLPVADASVIIGPGSPEDAAVFAVTKPAKLVQSVDFLRAFVDDPFLFGEIAANHALNDIFAMGAAPRYALATCVVPHGAARLVEEDLFQLLAGARRCLDREGVVLLGGHSSEGDDLSFGLTVTGEADGNGITRKGGLREGDRLILTRPLGTGILFAAAMRAEADATSVDGALALMRQSNRHAARTLVGHGATALTDVTGFGLAGHLGEMLSASGASARLDLDALPLHPQVRILAEGGIASTLLPENLALRGLIRGPVDDATLAILFDPQTSGGLLAGIPASRADACLAALHAAGYEGARAIGSVTSTGQAADGIAITLGTP